jgi:hypothetical protein
MIIVSILDLRKKVITIIHSTINLSRGIPKDRPEAMRVAESEFENFIESIPYFEDDLKKFLLAYSSGKKVFMIDRKWHSMFVGYISSWAHGPEWLGENVFGFEEDLVEYILADSPKLDLPLYSDGHDV